MSDYQIGDKVIVHNGNMLDITGRVASGPITVLYSEWFTSYQIYVIELDEGFFNPDKSIFVKSIICHEDRFRKVEK